MEHDFLEVYDKLSDLNESDQLNEKNNLKKAAMAAGLLAASAVGQMAGCSTQDAESSNETSTSEVSSTRSAPSAPNTSGYVAGTSTGADESESESSQVGYEDWVKHLDIMAALGKIKVHYQTGDAEQAIQDKSAMLTENTNTGTFSFNANETIVESSSFSKLYDVKDGSASVNVTKQNLVKVAVKPFMEQPSGNEPTFTIDTQLYFSVSWLWFENSDAFLQWLYDQIVASGALGFDLELWFEI